MSEPMRIRATLQGEVADVRILMRHPMETGQRKDAKGEIVPVHFIQSVVVAHNGKTVLDAQWSQAVSRDPFLGLRVKGAKAGDKITVTWTDNKGDKRSDEAVVAAAS
ncbi:MAG TPA: thiosulfate oxidation carrier complex protein SoxZ [Burkholderiales bacterium]|nr:thiosulfate oxidation carrier complex protein SoxZ [Burkholderiales bacterium]